MKALVFADSKDGSIVKSSFEAISYASKFASEVTVVTYAGVSDDQLSALGAYGAQKVIKASSLSDNDSQALTSLVCSVAQSEGSEAVVFSQDFTGKAVAGRVAVKLNAGLVSGAIDYPDTSSGFTVKKMAFSGKAFAHVKITSPIKVVSVLPNALGAENKGGSASVTEFSGQIEGSKVKITQSAQASSGGAAPLPEAELVVSAGRGLKGPENWGIVEDLANALGATTACSRPVADIGWRPHHEHVGQTGVAIRPNLYIAAGISGAIQHLAGVNGSKVIVVINTDPEAPFFKAADYGIVGDAFDVLPKLTEAVKKFKAS